MCMSGCPTFLKPVLLMGSEIQGKQFEPQGTHSGAPKQLDKDVDAMFTLPETNIAHENPHLSW